MKKNPKPPEQQERLETITPDEFNSRMDELLDLTLLEEIEKVINENRQAIKTPNGEWIH